MGDGHDRSDNGNSGGNTFLMGVLTGAVVGAGVALFCTSKMGEDLRNQIAEQANTIAKTAADKAQDGYRRVTETANDWADRGKDAFGKAREVLTKSADDTKEMYGKAREAVAKGADEVAAAARRS